MFIQVEWSLGDISYIRSLLLKIGQIYLPLYNVKLETEKYIISLFSDIIVLANKFNHLRVGR